MNNSLTFRLIIACAAAFTLQTAFGQNLYWVDGDFTAPKLGKSDLSGNSVTTVPLSTKSLPQGLALDGVHNKLYFTEAAYANAKVRSAGTDLSGVTAIDSSGSAMRGVVIDAARTKMYWTSSNLSSGSKIFGANLDGTGKQQLYGFSGGATNLRGIALSGSTLYWTDFKSGKIQAGDISGSAPVDLITGLSGPVGVGLGGDGYIYWTEANSNSIKRRTLVAGAVQTLISGLSKPSYLSIDQGGLKMYWTETGVTKIKKANTDGTNIQVLPMTLSHPTGIAVVSTSLPIQLSSFTSSVVNSTSVLLRWTTISETNNYGFSVERKLTAGLAFESLPGSFVAGHGTTLEPHQYSYTDSEAPHASLSYRLRQVDLDGTMHFTEPITVDLLTSVYEQAPVRFELAQNYPNPFNPTTAIRFSVETAGHATLEVFNALGQKVATLFDGMAGTGQYYTVRFDGINCASGIYYYRLESGAKSQLKKLVLLK